MRSRVLVALITAACIGALLFIDPRPGGAQTSCNGQPATIQARPGVVTRGTSGRDVIVGTSGDDIIRGRGGDDLICAGAGDDDVSGGRGNDVIDLGPGADVGRGGSGRDEIRGKRGRDTIEGNSGADRLHGGSARDLVRGGTGADLCDGGSGKDTLLSCAQRDRSVYYAAPGGSGNGARSDPFGSVNAAIATLRPGDTVFLRGGVYHEAIEVSVSGRPGALTIIRNAPGERAIIDGSGLATTSGWSPLIDIRNRSHIRVKGLEVRDRITSAAGHVPIGVLVAGSGDRIQIHDLEVHRVRAEAAGFRNGHGIAVYGTSASALRNVEIDGNHVHDLVLGTSEAVVVNGNVVDFSITNNHVHDVDNIGIDVIGFEGVAPPAVDQARRGLVANNHVHDVDARTNPSYLTANAGGIYVDGGADVVIEHNLVHDNNIGIELASEDPGGTTADVTVRDNVVHHNHIGGLLVGGYDPFRGATTGCRIEHNTFVDNDTLRTGTGEVALRHEVRDCVIRANIFRANSQGTLIVDSFGTLADITFTTNLFHTTGQRYWRWDGADYTTSRAWRAAVGDRGSRFADPRFRDAAARDYRLAADSPARNADGGTDLGADLGTVGPG